MDKKLDEIIKRLNQIEKMFDFYLSISRAKEQMRLGEYVPDPFLNDDPRDYGHLLNDSTKLF